MNQVAQLGFANTNPIGCESAFYSLMTALAPAEECLSYPRTCDTHSTIRNDMTDFIRQTVLKLSVFCSLPYQEGNGQELESSKMNGDLVRLGSGNATAGLALRVCHITEPNETACLSHDVAYVTLTPKLSFVKGVAKESPQPFNYRSEFYHLSELISGKETPATYFSSTKTGLYRFEGQKLPPPNCNDECNCQNMILGLSGLHGMSEKVAQFIIKSAGGIGKLCSLPHIHSSIDSNNLDSSLYLNTPLMRKDFSVVARLCPVGKTKDGEYICLPSDQRARPDPQVKTLSNLLKNSFQLGRTKNPYFVIAHVDLPFLRTVELELIYPSISWSSKREFKDSDSEAFIRLREQNVTQFDGIAEKDQPRRTIDLIRSMYPVHIPEQFYAESSYPIPLKLDQKNG